MLPDVSMTGSLLPGDSRGQGQNHEPLPRVRENVPTIGNCVPLRVQRGQVRVWNIVTSSVITQRAWSPCTHPAPAGGAPLPKEALL